MKFLLLPGDGIGPEIMQATETVLSAVGRRYGVDIAADRKDVGEKALSHAAAAIEGAIDALLSSPETRTPDLGGPLGTRAFGEALAARVGAN